MHRIIENDEHGKNENECQICTVYQKMMNMAKLETSRTFFSVTKTAIQMLEILESNSWRGCGHAPTPRYSQAIHRANQQEFATQIRRQFMNTASLAAGTEVFHWQKANLKVAHDESLNSDGH